MCEKAPLELLSGQLAQNVALLSEHLRAAGLAQPSFARDAPTVVLPYDAPESVKRVREELMECALGIFDLVAGPSEYLPNLIIGGQYIFCVHWLSHFKIFSLTPLKGTISYTQLAGLAGVAETRLKNVTRMAMTKHLFVEPTPGTLGHSATSALLATHPNFADQAVWTTEITARSAAAMVEAHEKWPTSTANNRTPFNIAFGTDLPMYDYIKKKPDLQKRFGRIMKLVAESPATDLKHLVNGFDWAGIGKGLVVDVGGNLGRSCAAVAQAFPDLNFIVQDVTHVVAEGKEYIGSLEDGNLNHRITFQAHDFFDEQPVMGAKVYLLRQILHNWNDENSVRLLSKLAVALELGSRIVIMDIVLPRPGSVPSVRERLLRHKDLSMMQLFNAHERDVADWELILAEVQPKLKLRNITQPFASEFSLLDVVLAED